ncbi:hypothetical protein [Enterobacter roggenkampii]|uniref:hypothetical protein n=1 Tax=Enterobacter roggenkampii TaxID=1812935 RepID=UPI002FD80CA2
MDFAGHVEGTKKPAGLTPCELSGLHQSTLVIADGEFWCWRPCNWWGRWLSLLGILIFLREGEGAKRVAMVLIWKGFFYLFDF